jgi:hypothetical protein
LFWGWWPIYIFAEKDMYYADAQLFTLIVHPVIIVAINYIVNKKLTLWYKEPKGD